MMKHAVIVDDNDSFLRFLSFYFAREDFKVTSTTQGRELLGILRMGRPDVVLLDRNLPDWDGMALCRKIKTHFKDIPVLMFTGEIEEKGLEETADDFLPKPFPIDLLLSKVKDICHCA